MELKPKATESKTASKVAQYEAKLTAHFDQLLEPDETLLGHATASQQKNMFSGGVVSLATTDRRLFIQTMDRKGNFKEGEVISLARSDIASVKVSGAGGAWDDPSAAIMNRSAISLKLKTTGGDKFKFSLFDGSGIIGSWGGGASQQNGVAALLAFLGESEAGGI